jgi:hypothetical protein
LKKIGHRFLIFDENYKPTNPGISMTPKKKKYQNKAL